MQPLVEPIDGSELDRLITALLNVTGAVHRIVEEERLGPDDGLGLEIIGRCAVRMRSMLALFSEHHDDEELAPITEFLATAAVLVAQEGGFDDVFYPA